MIVSLDETSCAWGSDVDVDTNATDNPNGRKNMATIIALDEDFSDYPAFEWCHEKNTGATASTYADDATGVWYLPAYDELKALYEAKALINSTLATLATSGTELSTGYYWISVEEDSQNAWFMDFSDVYCTYSDKTDSYNVRAVLAF